jgi:hypothetical protein
MKEAVITILGTILLILSVVCIVVGLVGMVTAQSRPVTFPEHPQHATYVILPYGGTTSVAQGEQTSNFPSPAFPISLGEVARRNRIEHESVPKSKCVWEDLCHLLSKIDCLSR